MMYPKFPFSFVLFLFFIVLSCNDETSVAPDPTATTFSNLPDGVKMSGDVEERIKAEILSMAHDNPPHGEVSKASVPTPPPTSPPTTLPPGYNYSQLTQVSIAGVNAITYVAYSNTINSATRKDLVAIYYNTEGVYKNYIVVQWEALSNGTASFTFRYPCGVVGLPHGSQIFIVDPAKGNVVNKRTVLAPSECGQRVASCIDDFYTNKGWLSVGLVIGTIFQPEIGVGVVGGCMLGCAFDLYMSCGTI